MELFVKNMGMKLDLTTPTNSHTQEKLVATLPYEV